MKKTLGTLLGLTNHSQQLITQISNLSGKKNESVSNTFKHYDPGKLEFESPDGILKGEKELTEYISKTKNKGKKVFAKSQVAVDLALEGGGAYGFAHLGVAHGFALKGIGFDRISGTSAGAIAAALLAGGYQVDLNFSTDTDVRTTAALEPDGRNSANQILFDDFFKPFTDMPVDAASVTTMLDESWFIKAIDKKLDELIQKQVVDKCQDIKMDFTLLTAEIQKSVFASFDQYGMGFVLDAPIAGQASFVTPRSIIAGSLMAITTTLKNAGDFTRLFSSMIAKDVKNKITGAIKSSLSAFILEDSINVKNYSVYGLLRLLQYGGFWNGIYIRDWMEYHLQQKVRGTGELLDGSKDQQIPRPLIANEQPNKKEKYKRAVTFKDLPIDLCITAAVVGKTTEPFDAKNIRIVYFSRKTSPDYPVAEAVRRSMSLPFVFIPREIYEGYAKKNTVLKTSDYDPNDELVQPKDLSKLSEPYIPDDAVCLDGGFLVNLPVAVFRDKSNEVFDCYFKGNSFQKLLIISNLTGALKASQRPFDIPRAVMPQPLHHLIDTQSDGELVSDAQHLADTVFGSHDIKVSRGMDKTMLSAMTTIATSPVGIWKDFEIDLLLCLVPNSILVQTPLLDPNPDNRLVGSEFNMPKTTKKWLLKNAFDAVRLSLREAEEQMPSMAGKLQIDPATDPYLHLLSVTNVSLLHETIPANAADAVLYRTNNGSSPAKDGDTLYMNNGLTIEKFIARDQPAVQFHNFGRMAKTYAGFGYSWIKIQNNNNNISNAKSEFISFIINIKSKITLLLDVKPGFTTAEEWIEEPWQAKGSNGIIFKAFSKKFEKGKITIPGPKYLQDNGNQFAFAILVRPV